MMLKFLYTTVPGRYLLKVLTKPQLSNYCGLFLDSKYSKVLIKPFIKSNNINMKEYKKVEYKNFNECFSREIKPECRPIDMNNESLISPCDGLLSGYRISDDLVIPVKGSVYRISDLLRGDDLYKKYEDGICLVFRLCVNHYHRYCYIDNGSKENNTFLPGILHTVQPIALRNVPVFTENSREYTVLHTENFGDVCQVEVGAMLVGKINNYHLAGDIKRGEEKGCFLYGGSTIILLLEPEKVKITEKLFKMTDMNKEVPVKMGQKIGAKIV